MISFIGRPGIVDMFYLIDWKTIGVFIAVMAYMCFMFRLNKKFIASKRFSDEEYLYKMARIGECSVYDMFFVCAEKWQYSKERVENDFREYLLHNRIPFYVRDFARAYRKELDRYDTPYFRFL
jgi:hypothetical protein